MADASRLRSLWMEIAAKHNVCIPAGGVNHLDEADRELLIDALLQELLLTGLGADDEPNHRGAWIEEIIDFVRSITGQGGCIRGPRSR